VSLSKVALPAVAAALWLVAAYLLWPTVVPDDLSLPSVDEQRLFDEDVLDETATYERFLRWNDVASQVVLLLDRAAAVRGGGDLVAEAPRPRHRRLSRVGAPELVPARRAVPVHLPVAADHDGAGGAAS
jgi:hypothetical protein